MGSKIDGTAPDVYKKSEGQYKLGVTKEGMAPGDPEKKDRPKEEITSDD